MLARMPALAMRIMIARARSVSLALSRRFTRLCDEFIGLREGGSYLLRGEAKR